MFVGFPGVCDPAWPKRVKPIESFQAFKEASDRTELSVSRLKHERLRLEQAEAEHYSMLDERVALCLELRKKMMRETAEEQRRQISEQNTAKRLLQEEKKRPGISPECHGYPSIPETPTDLRLRRKVSQQRKFREELQRQMEANKCQEAARKDLELSLHHKMVQDAEKVARDWQQKEEDKKKHIKAEMRQGWERAMQYKNSQSVLESFASSYATTPVSNSLYPAASEASHGHSQLSQSFSTPFKLSVPPLPPSKPIRLFDAQEMAARRKLAARLKEREEERARKSLEVQMEQHYKTYSIDNPKLQGESFDFLPGLLKGHKPSHFRKVSGLSEKSEVRSRRPRPL